MDKRKSTPTRIDKAPYKRIELHCHTNMSAYDGISDVADIINRTHEWGHKAIAITDHGVVQAFPDAYKTINKINAKNSKKSPVFEEFHSFPEEPFKIIYGLEAYLVDDSINNKYIFQGVSVDDIYERSLPSYHAVILVANETGLRNLYTLISESHLRYLSKVPRIPKSLLQKHREGLLIGSACETGELQTFVRDIFQNGQQNTDVECLNYHYPNIRKIFYFYDYLEIQPGNNNHDLNKKIVELGKHYNKPVVATGDVHYLDLEDEICYRILKSVKGQTDIEEPKYLLTTEEMLEAFAYLGREKAFEVVVTNSNLIADMIESISPIHQVKSLPQIPESDKVLTGICSTRVCELYGGEGIPQMVETRLDTELAAIRQSKTAIYYLVAREVVRKANEDGYLVGYRGSVGASFVAFLAGITEVNPLRPHYHCPWGCYNDVPEMEKNIHCGFDLPDKLCQECGEKLNKDGFNIPFETFAGLYGDKEPDIDFNISEVYKKKLFGNFEDFFGIGQIIRAGTLITIGRKTAYEYMEKYFKDCGITKTDYELAGIVDKLANVRKGTGIHPGGLFILPYGEDINSLTPIQRLANDLKSKNTTTHFHYHFLDKSLMRIDLLDHIFPEILKQLADLTGTDIQTIPFDDVKVFDFIMKNKADYIPEFGGKYAQAIIEITQPKTFADFIKVSGLIHGTGVWQENAEVILTENIADFSEIIAFRDDIMLYLLEKGFARETAYEVMENVRRGRGLKSEWKELMFEAGIPDWYIESCEKIEYLFPKAHSVGYVKMAMRIIWFIVYYPQEFWQLYEKLH